MRRPLWGLAALLLLAVAGAGVLVAWSGRGALAAGANGAPWIFRFAALVVLPLSCVGYCVWKAFKPPHT